MGDGGAAECLGPLAQMRAGQRCSRFDSGAILAVERDRVHAGEGEAVIARGTGQSPCIAAVEQDRVGQDETAVNGFEMGRIIGHESLTFLSGRI